MTTIEGQRVFYSVGADGKDDQAKLQYEAGSPDGRGDVVFRLGKRG
ncbi:hypothetical protein [Novipirellula artificiosorum]|uniref:Uncharacterized protein n=1 Tax=Novipirellula artificiosorum TaxID=2528016 RepID=A0A5C6E3K9_9BACT|nr:hypothetical protein [Novipirellula artificiosorum]TWU42567.1 hypothetical protein Poly41_08640 [Novipirellula artificiosorum]